MPVDLPLTLLFLGRLLLGGAFVVAGLRNVQNEIFLTGLMAERGVPQAKLALWAGIVLQTIAGALVMAGLWTAIASAVLVLFLIVATPMFPQFLGPSRPGPGLAHQRLRRQCCAGRRIPDADRAVTLATTPRSSTAHAAKRKPPSQVRTWPVIKPLATRKAIAQATSSAWPILPTGVLSA